MKNKGFTLIELLVVIVLMSLLSGVAVVFSSSFYKTSEERYYDALENNILLAGNDYFEDHRDELPTGVNYSEVSLASLIDNRYIEPVTDTNGNLCRNGSVFAYRENNKFKYETCLVDCGGYSSSGRYCSNILSREIIVSAKTKTTKATYDVTRSYNAASYTKNENVLVTMNMNSDYSITKYILTNTNDNSEIVCNTSNDNTCTKEINKSGTYKIESYEGNNEISSKYINIKIARNGSDFTLNTSDGQRKYLISQNDCSKNIKTKQITFNIIKGNSNEEYKSIEYRINNDEYTEINSLSKTLTLESGHYDIDVAVTNYNDDVSVETLSIDISYLINIEYNDDNSTATHEVVKGKPYNYLSSLPVTKNGKDIKWYKGETLINPVTDIVGEDCTYKIDGITKISYTLNYSDNLFAAQSQSTNGVTATYTEAGSYLTLDGTGTAKSFVDALWNLDRRSFNAGDQYKVTIKYVSGTLTCSDSATCTGSDGKPLFVLELTSDGSNLSNRGVSPVSYKNINLPVSGTSEATLTVDSTRTNANGFKFWLWQHNENVATFSNYKVQIIITKVHSNSVVYGEKYGTLGTTEKSGYTFDGWYTAITGGTKVTSESVYETEGNQTLYARYTPHKLNLQYNGNGSDVTWCSTSSVYSMDSNKYAVTQSSSSKDTHVVAYGQYMSYTSGLNNYDNKTYFCFAKKGYKAASGAEWVLSTNSSKKYDQNNKTYTAIGIANDAGCDLKTTATCTAQVNVNWTPNALTFNNQSISKSFSTSAQTFNVTEASNGTDTYTYAISSQPSGNYFTISGTKVTIKANTPAGSHEVVIKATDSNSKVTKEATYTVAIAKVNATCPTISDWTGSYDGSQHSINVSGGSGGSIQYRWNSTTEAWRDTKPTASVAGTWKVYVQMKGDSNHNTVDCGYKTLTINKVKAVITCANKTYNGSAQTIATCAGGTISGASQTNYKSGGYSITCAGDSNHTAADAKTCSINQKALTITAKAQTINYGASIATGTGQVTADGLVSGDSLTAITLKASTANVTTSGTITPSAATTSKGIGNYSVTYKTGTLKINKVAATCPTLTAYSGTYDSSAHTISVSGGSGGTIKYRTSTSESWTTTKPSRTAAGTTTVYVMVAGDSNHTDKDCGSKAITINKAASSITCSNKTYNGSAQNMYSIASGCTPDKNKTATTAGTYTVTCKGDTNHNDSSCSATMNKATPSFLLTETSGSMYVDGTKTYGIYPNVNGRHDYASTNTNVVGIVKLTDDATCSTANKQCIFQLTGKAEGQNIVINHVFTPSDTTNYNSVSATFKATVTAPPCYKLTCSCKVNGSWKTKNNMIVSSEASNFCSNTSAKEAACNNICWTAFGGGSVQAVTVGSECSSSSCPALTNGSTTSEYAWARRLTCSGAYSDLSGISYYQTEASCNNACSSRPAPSFCGCRCYRR